MKRGRPHGDNEVEVVGLTREKDDGIYLVDIIFQSGYGPILIFDQAGNPQLEGGEYEIRKATWSKYNTTGRGAYIKSDRPSANWGCGPLLGGNIIFQDGQPVVMWEHGEDFTVTGRGVKTRVRKVDRGLFRVTEALRVLKEDHPRITLKSVHARLYPLARRVFPRKSRPSYQPTGNKRGAPIKSEFTIEIRKLRDSGIPSRDAQKMMFAWHRHRFPVDDPLSRSRESVNRSVRRIYAEET